MDSPASGGSGNASPASSTGIGTERSTRAERDRRRLTRRIIGGALIVATTIIGMTAVMMWRLEQAQLDDGLTDVAALDLLVASQTERAFESVGVVLDDISADLQAQNIVSAAALREATGGEATFRLLRAKIAGIAQLDALAIATSEGDVVNRTYSYPVTNHTNVAGREYFSRLRDHPELSAYISPPLQGSDGKLVIYIGKRLNAPNGAFIGIVLGAIHVDYFQDLYGNSLDVLVGDGKSTALWRNDGLLLARSPADSVSALDANPPDFTRPIPSNGLLSYWSKDSDGKTIAIAQRRLDKFPLVVELRQSASAMLAPWSDEFLATGLGGGALLILVGVALWLLLRQLQTQSLIIEERARANREVEAREDIERARMKAEAAMRDAQRSEGRFRDIAEVGSDWIWETDAEHRFTLIAGARKPKVSLIGKTRWDQANGDPETDPVWREHKAVLDAHRPFRQFRFALDLPDGRFHVCVSGKPIFDDDGSFVGYRGTVSDETELIDTRERATRADELLRNAIESIAEGFVIYDKDDRFVLCNEAFRKMYPQNAAAFVPGASFEEIMRSAVATGRYRDAAGREEEWLAEHVRQHREGSVSDEYQLADGRWVLHSERPMADGGIAGLRIDVTALKQAQESLRESQVMLNRAQKLSGTGSVVRNLVTLATEWSDEMYRIFGVERGSFEPRTDRFLAMVHPEDRALIEELLSKSFDAQREAPIEFRIVRPDGTIRWVYREADFWRDPEGKTGMRLTTYKDVTEKREADMRHRALEALLRDAIESISEGFVIYDADDRLVLCNEAYRNLYPESSELLVPGVRFEDVVRSALKEGRYPDAVGREEEWLASTLHNRSQRNGTIEAPWSDGRWMLISERPTSSGGTAGLRVDITKLKRVQQSLHESQQRFDRTQRIAHIGTIERDLSNNSVVWSDETYRIFGLTPETHTPTFGTLMNYVHPDDREHVLRAFRSHDFGQRTSSLKYRVLRPNGDIRIVSCQADTTFDANGEPLYVSVAMVDVTDKEHASQRQLELETQLRHSEKLTALGTLAGGIAHDLNNTLVPIQALSKLVMQEIPADAPAHGDLETIHQASLQARDLVRQILAFSRKQEMLNAPTDIAVRVQEALQMLRASVPSTIDIVENIAPIPPISADGTQIQQIVVNLVTNGAFAIGNRCGRVTVTLDEIAPEPDMPRMIRLVIADTGCGMSPEIMHRMFEPFFTTKSVGEGTGLGLSVVHGIVTSLGGKIDVRSTPGEGTEFAVTLPVKSVEETVDIAAVA